MPHGLEPPCGGHFSAVFRAVAPRSKGANLLFNSRVGFALVALAVHGCCVRPPAPERYFDRATPLNAATFFRYAVDARNYEAAYACLAPATQSRVSLAKFRSFLRWWTFSQWDDLRVHDFIVEGRQYLDLEREGAGRDLAHIVHVYTSSRGDWWEERIPLVRTGEEWRIDLSQMGSFGL